MATAAAPTTVGKIVQVIGPVIDVAFETDGLPELYNALRIEGTAGGVEDGPGAWTRALSDALSSC